MRHGPRLLTTLNRRAASALTLLVAALVAPSVLGADARVFVGTWSGSADSGGRVLEWMPGAGWEDLTPAAGFAAVWDLAAIDGELWAATADGTVWRLDGSTWTLEHSAGATASGIDVVGGQVHVTSFRGVDRRNADGSWTRVATMNEPARAVAADGHDGRPMLYVGDNGHDQFWVHDPDGMLSCGAPCPGANGACPAGCFGGSCIYGG